METTKDKVRLNSRIEFDCGGCGGRLSADVTHVGVNALCPFCETFTEARVEPVLSGGVFVAGPGQFVPHHFEGFGFDASWRERIHKRRRARAKVRKCERAIEALRDSFIVRERRLVLGTLALTLGGGLVLFACVGGH